MNNFKVNIESLILAICLYGIWNKIFITSNNIFMDLIYLFSYVYTLCFLFIVIDDIVDDIIYKIKDYIKYTSKGLKIPKYYQFDFDKVFEINKGRELYLDLIYRPIYKLTKFPETATFYIKRSYQRSVRGWADTDIWSIPSFNSPVMVGMIKRLKKTKTGIPCKIFDDSSNMSDKSCNLAMKKWNKILDKIIKTFEVADKITKFHWIYQNSEEYDYSLVRKWKKLNKEGKEKRIKRVGKDPFEEDYVHVMTKKECKEYEEGWNLFVKHYHDLWN